MFLATPVLYIVRHDTGTECISKRIDTADVGVKSVLWVFITIKHYNWSREIGSVMVVINRLHLSDSCVILLCNC